MKFDDYTIYYEPEHRGGSSNDLAFAIARANIQGEIEVVIGPASSTDEVNLLSVHADVQVGDLYDFNFFPDPMSTRHAATLQAGWEAFSGDTGGPGQVFFARYFVEAGFYPSASQNYFIIKQP